MGNENLKVKKRESNIELLRFILMMLILIHHYAWNNDDLINFSRVTQIIAVFGGYWFITSYIQLYVLSPFLVNVTNISAGNLFCYENFFDKSNRTYEIS